MKINSLKITGSFEIVLTPISDDRGFFMRTFDDKLFKEAGLHNNWVQENHSKTLKKGTIRGFHFQLPPFSETKLIRCIKGKVLDVFVDLRRNSATFGKWDALELSEDIPKAILLPRGIAHGFYTLTDDCHLLYKHDNYFNPDYYSGILWNDPDLNIDWPSQDVFVSEKDRNLMTLKKFVAIYGGIE